MSPTNIQCKRINRTFLTVLDENPLAAALMLGNLYQSLKKAEDQDLTLLKTTLSDLKEKFTPNITQQLWKSITDISPRRLRIMEQTNRDTLQHLKHEIVRDIDFFKHLEVSSLVNLGQDVNFYREVLVALIRKQLHEDKKFDPFAKSDFSYECLREGGSEQNFRYLAEYVKQCPSLPLENIVLLGTEDNEIATLILIDLKDCQIRFEIGNRFAHLHSELREEIAKEWQSYLETLPQTTKETKFLEKELPKLKKEFPEFADVDLHSRVERNYQIITPTQPKSFMRRVTEGLIGGTAGAVALPSYMALFGLVFTVPAAVVTIPIGLGCAFTFDYARVSMKRAQERSLINIPQPSSRLTSPRL